MRACSKATKSQYTEFEVAEELGVSVERLRSIIRDHIIPRDEDIRYAATVTFQPSDLLLLRLLASQPAGETTQP